jgi:hypothetical protein
MCSSGGNLQETTPPVILQEKSSKIGFKTIHDFCKHPKHAK